MMVVVVGDVLHHVKREGELSGRGNVRGTCPVGNMSGGKYPDPVRINDTDDGVCEGVHGGR